MGSGLLPLLVGLLVTYCYRVPSVIAIPDRKDIYVEDDWPVRRSYRVEDFLWTGSGDGQDFILGSSDLTTMTVVHTTIFPTPVLTSPHHGTVSPTCCVTGVIRPTSTLGPPLATPRPTLPPVQAPDQRFWLLTVVQMNLTQVTPSQVDLENKLARLYRLAFNRQQEHHLGIGNATAQAILRQRLRRDRDRRVPEPVNVYLHNQSSEGSARLALLYSVHVDGKPVLAYTAAADMKLVSTNEATAELGFPILTKAEPYLKDNHPLDGGWKKARSRDTWLLVGSAVAAVALLLLLAVLLALGLGKRKRNKRRVLASSNRRQVFEREAGTANLAYHDEEGNTKTGSVSGHSSPGMLSVAPPLAVTSIYHGDQEGSAAVGERKSSATSLSSGESSEASLVRRRAAPSSRRKVPEEEQGRPQPQPRRRHHTSHQGQHTAQTIRKKTRSPLPSLEHTRNAQRQYVDGSMEEPVVPTINAAISPNSFLSMPSIKAFPRGASIPEPLARVLEPVSVKYLDSEAGLVLEPARKMARHGSLEGEDPGVVGPLVWDMHCHRMHCQPLPQAGCLEGNLIEDLVLEAAADDLSRPDAAAPNMGRMRQRFQELLDDAFSLFGSRSVSPAGGVEEDSSTPPTLHRVRSAIVRPVGEPLLGSDEFAPRPRTSDYRRPATAAAGTSRPRGAWGTAHSSPPTGRSGTLPRPLSAGPFHRPQLPVPAVDRVLVLSEEQLPLADPAIPLIAAIKEELCKFQQPPAVSLPGST